uniref:Uncharacterized protein n=1 Tax=viral metagenome TaxID=1070528 RepID=A0A6C0LPS1_9ZZZZ
MSIYGYPPYFYGPYIYGYPYNPYYPYYYPSLYTNYGLYQNDILDDRSIKPDASMNHPKEAEMDTSCNMMPKEIFTDASCNSDIPREQSTFHNSIFPEPPHVYNQVHHSPWYGHHYPPYFPPYRPPYHPPYYPPYRPPYYPPYRPPYYNYT